MYQTRARIVSVVMFLAILVVSSPLAMKVQQMNLQDLVQRADKIFRCTVVEIEPGTVNAGGGAIPTTTYRVRINETIKGDFGERGIPIFEIQMVGSIKRESEGEDVRRFQLFKDIPRLTVGKEYLLFTTAASRIGLSTTVGLAQGCFRVYPIDKQPHVLNGVDNYGLFRGLDSGGLPERGPIAYSALKSKIRTLMGQ